LSSLDGICKGNFTLTVITYCITYFVGLHWPFCFSDRITAVQYGVQYSTVQYSTVQYSTNEKGTKIASPDLTFRITLPSLRVGVYSKVTP